MEYFIFSEIYLFLASLEIFYTLPIYWLSTFYIYLENGNLKKKWIKSQTQGGAVLKWNCDKRTDHPGVSKEDSLPKGLKQDVCAQDRSWGGKA